MTRAALSVSIAVLLIGSSLELDLSARQTTARDQKPAATSPVPSHTQAAASVPLAAATPIVRQYCTACHSDRGKAGGLSLVALDATRAATEAPVAEKMIGK